MKISVVTATWNSEGTILDTLKSFGEQSYEDVEYIVIDGKSSDGTLDLINRSGVKVDKLVSEKDSGIYDALNKGISLATGDVVGFLHSDDVYANPEVLGKIAGQFCEGKADAVYGDLDYVSKENPARIIRSWKSGAYSRSKIKDGWMPPHPTFYMKRAYYLKYGGFDTSYRIAADYDSILRYLWKHQLPATYIPETLVKMRVGGESNRSIKNIIKKSKEDCAAMKKNEVPAFRALIGKNISKIPQFIVRV